MRTEGSNSSEVFLKSVLVNYEGQGDGPEEQLNVSALGQTVQKASGQALKSTTSPPPCQLC